jgi:hypothetical protein
MMSEVAWDVSDGRSDGVCRVNLKGGGGAGKTREVRQSERQRGRIKSRLPGKAADESKDE